MTSQPHPSDHPLPHRAAALVFGSYPPPASIRILGAAPARLGSILEAAGYDIADVSAKSDVVLLWTPVDEATVKIALASLASNGVVIAGGETGQRSIVEAAGFKAMAPASQGWVAFSKSVAGNAEPAKQDAIEARLAGLEQRLSDQITQLAQKNTYIAGAIDRLSYQLSLKGRLVGALRRTGLLGPAASALNWVRAARSGTRALGKAANTSVMTLANGTIVSAPIVVAATGAAAEDVKSAARAAGALVIALQPGNGSAGEGATLVRPSSETLAGWLATARKDDFAAVRSFMIDPVADPDAMNLLRGRLRPDQTILMPQGKGEPPADLGPPTATKGQLAVYASPPPAWLDTLDATGRPSPANLAAGTWPKISMVMVSFNQAAFLEEGIRSILDQGYPNLEFIMVDGASKDGSIDILERYRAHFDVLIIEKDRGQSDGLTKGFDRATGEIVSWLNSDDLLLPGALFRVAEAFTRHKPDMVAGGCLQVKQDGIEVALAHHNHLPFGRVMPLPLDQLLDFDNRWLGGCFFFQPEVFFTRDIWLRAGGGLRLDLYYVLDYDLWLRMAGAGATILHIPDFLASSRIHELQKTTFGETPFVPETRRLLAEYATGVRWIRPRD